VIRELGLPLDGGGRIETDPTCRVKGWENMWAIWEAAAVPGDLEERRAEAEKSSE
jgi:NADH dehydrogenase